MEIAMARDSPLGQYLAELDSEVGGENLTAGLLPAAPPRSPAAARRRPHAAAMLVALYSEFKSLGSRLLLQSELRPLGVVYEALDAAWPAWRDIHAVELLAVETTNPGKFLHQLEPRAVGVVTAALVPVVAALAFSHGLSIQTEPWGREHIDTSISGSLRSLVSALGLVVGCVVSLELVFLLLVVRGTTQARRLRSAVRSFVTARKDVESAFRSSLDLVKKAELASRGYRLGGTFLPPVGRLEKLTDRLHCVELRRLLRSLNEKLVTHANSILNAENDMKNDTLLTTQTRTINEDSSAPSLLITALAKRHAAATLAVDNALRSSLLDLVSPLWEAQREQSASSTQLNKRMQACQHRLEQSSGLFHAWESALERQSRHVSAVVREDALSPSAESSQDRVEHEEETSPQPTTDQTKSRLIESQLHELWTACETLSSLIVAARHDLAASASATDIPSAEQDNASPEKWGTRLASTRELMEKRVQELRSAWEDYDQALAGALSSSDPSDKPTSDPSTEGDNFGDANAPIRSLAPPKQPEDDDCTVVFTGTSTGEKDFDLQSILRQHQDADGAPAAGRFFVRELRDVLAYRETNTRSRTITKDIDGDASTAGVRKLAGVAGDEAVAPRALPSRPAMRPMDLSAALKSELQSLRLPFAAIDSEDETELRDELE